MAKQVEIKERESKTDIAYRLMAKKKKSGPKNFYDLWEAIKAELAKVATDEEMANIENDISFFYTSLTLDGRFVNVGDNKWELRERVKFEKIKNIIEQSEITEDENDESDEDKEESKVSNENEDNFDEKYDDSTGSDADIDLFREQKEQEEEEF